MGFNKVKGPSRERQGRIAKKANAHNKVVTIIPGGVTSKKKLQKLEKAIKREKKYIATLAMGVTEEDMDDAQPEKRVEIKRVAVQVPEEILAAAAAGPGTTLGSPQ